MATDEQLVADYRGGNEGAFAELVGRYQRELFVFLQRFVLSSAVAEDLFQETFIQVHRNIHMFDPARRFRPWLFTIAANKARDHLRAQQRRGTQSLDNTAGGSGGGTFVDLMQSDLPGPQEMLSREEDIAAVRQALDAIPAMYREILLLSYFHKFAYKQIAEMLGIPLGTVKSRLHAALAIFARAWEAQHQEQRPGGQ